VSRKLWPDLPSSDYSESLRELAGMASKEGGSKKEEGRSRKEEGKLGK
jgi:hypothetical protein